MQKIKSRGPSLMPIILTILTSSLSYQKDERAKPGNLLTKWRSFSLPERNVSRLSHEFPATHSSDTFLPLHICLPLSFIDVC
jgi:hypothetical protein